MFHMCGHTQPEPHRVFYWYAIVDLGWRTRCHVESERVSLVTTVLTRASAVAWRDMLGRRPTRKRNLRWHAVTRGAGCEQVEAWW